MPDDSRVAIRLLTLGVALLAIGTAQMCRYVLDKRMRDGEPEQKTERQMLWMKRCDHLTAVLLVMAGMHAIAIAST